MHVAAVPKPDRRACSPLRARASARRARASSRPVRLHSDARLRIVRDGSIRTVLLPTRWEYRISRVAISVSNPSNPRAVHVRDATIAIEAIGIGDERPQRFRARLQVPLPPVVKFASAHSTKALTRSTPQHKHGVHGKALSKNLLSSGCGRSRSRDRHLHDRRCPAAHGTATAVARKVVGGDVQHVIARRCECDHR